MDPVQLVEIGSQGAMVAVVLACFKALESRNNKKNNNTSDLRIEVLREKIESCDERVQELLDDIKEFRKEFVSFREEVRIAWVKQSIEKEASNG